MVEESGWIQVTWNNQQGLWADQQKAMRVQGELKMNQVDHRAISCGANTKRAVALFGHAITKEPVSHSRGETGLKIS